MFLFFESIRVVNGRIMNLLEHQERIDRCLGSTDINLRKFTKTLDIPTNGVFKLRIQYNSKSKKITKHSIKKYTETLIRSLKIVESKSLKYNHKSEDRKTLNSTYELKGTCDDVLIIINNKFTDTWYCNIAFYNGEEWHTPKDCLLKGTMRSKLIKKKIIKEIEIKISDITKYKKVRLFNAMIPWSKKKDILVNQIY